MADEKGQSDPIEQLLDLLVYAPLGLVTQLDELLPGLIERGRSQAVMARTIGEFAVRAGSEKVQDRAGGAQRQLETIVRSLLDLAASTLASEPAREEPTETTDEPIVDRDSSEDSELPIAEYDQRKAAEIVPLLSKLSAEQRSVIAAHETSNRNRRTILNRIQQLGSDEPR
jgi:hypothetical protein